MDQYPLAAKVFRYLLQNQIVMFPWSGEVGASSMIK